MTEKIKRKKFSKIIYNTYNNRKAQEEKDKIENSSKVFDK